MRAVSETRAFRSTTCGSITCLRLKARSWRTRRAARSEAPMTCCRLAQARIVRVEAPAQQLAVAHDHHEQVVEVVGDAAREPADRLHLLRLAQLLLEPPPLLLGLAPLRDVQEHHRHHPRRGLERVDLVRAPEAVVAGGDLGSPRAPLGAEATVSVRDLGAGQAGEGLLDLPADERAHRCADDPVARGVGAGEHQAARLLQAVEVNPHRGRLDDRANPRLGVAKARLDHAALLDLRAEAGDRPSQLRGRVKGHADQAEQAGEEDAEGDPGPRGRGGRQPAAHLGPRDAKARDHDEGCRRRRAPNPEEQGGRQRHYGVGARRGGLEAPEEPERQGDKQPQPAQVEEAASRVHPLRASTPIPSSAASMARVRRRAPGSSWLPATTRNAEVTTPLSRRNALSSRASRASSPSHCSAGEGKRRRARSVRVGMGSVRTILRPESAEFSTSGCAHPVDRCAPTVETRFIRCGIAVCFPCTACGSAVHRLFIGCGQDSGPQRAAVG